MTNYCPYSFEDYIGQDHIKKRLQLAIDASSHRAERLPHMLFIAPAGTGKTALARIVAESMMATPKELIAPIHDRVLRFAMEEALDILFIDEIHNLTRKQQEGLLPLLSEGFYQDAKGHQYELDHLTVIGATTEGDKVIRPLYTRFPIKPLWEEYTDDELAEIVQNMARAYELDVSLEWCQIVSKATLGIPRNGLAVIELAHDLVTVHGVLPSAEELLDTLRTTPEGFTREHIRYLETLRAAGGRAGLDTMRHLLGQPAGHIEALEIDLIKKGIIERAASGREMTGRGMRLLNRLRKEQDVKPNG